MGYAHKQNIQAAADWLIAKLQFQNPIRYSELYETGTLDKAGELLGMSSMQPFCVMVDCAVNQLARHGVVTSTELDHVMSDDTNDYEIFLTWKHVGKPPEMVGMDL